MRAFAVGFKDQVEIRIAESPPKEVKSQVVRKLTPQKRPPYWDDYLDGKWQGGKNKMTISSIIHTGGRVVNVITSRMFKSRTGLHPPKHGEMIEINYALIDTLRKGKDG